MDFHDSLIFEKSEKYSLTSSGYSVPNDETNIIFKAYQAIKPTKVNNEFSIILQKNIPIGSGLGGGSSNAATTLKTLNKLWNLNYSNKKLLNFARKIGADVSFFINGGIQKVEGIGDILSPIKTTAFEKKIFLLIIPNFSISTRWAYSKIKKYLSLENNSAKFCTLDLSRNLKLFENVFEHVVVSTYPGIGDIKKILLSEGAIYSSLSGSGSTVFGIFNDKVQAEIAASKFPSYKSIVSKIPNKDITLI